MDFPAFLYKKRIDADRFRTQKEAEWLRLRNMYEELGEKAFDQHKKFYFNPLRLMFPYTPPVSEQRVSEKPATAIPKKIPKPVVEIPKEENPSEIQKAKPLPPKMKPVMKPKVVEEAEKSVTETPVEQPGVEALHATPPTIEQSETPAEPQPEVRKLPPKMKPVMKPKVVEEAEKSETHAEQPGVEALNATPPTIEQSETHAEPQPEVRKMPPKMKPVMRRDKDNPES